MSHLIAHGHPEYVIGQADPEQALGNAFLTDAGGLTINIESPDGDAANDIVIRFPPHAVEDSVRRRIRGRR